MSNFMDSEKLSEEKRQVIIYGPQVGTEQITSDQKPLARTKSKVAIMGFAPSTMSDVKFIWDDPELEIWGLNQMHVAFPALVERATRWFQIHQKHSYDINLARDKSHHDWLKEQRNFPIYMIDKFDDVPMSIKWPHREIMATLGTDYFTNSISWMIALAIVERMHLPLEIRKKSDMYIFGVDMAQSDEIDSEYGEQRPSCEYFIGMARGLGIPVHIPDKSDLLKTMWLYPYEDNSPFRTKLEARRVEMRQRVNMLANQEENMRAERLQLMGAIENQHYIKRCWDNSINELKVQNGLLDNINTVYAPLNEIGEDVQEMPVPEEVEADTIKDTVDKEVKVHNTSEPFIEEDKTDWPSTGDVRPYHGSPPSSQPCSESDPAYTIETNKHCWPSTNVKHPPVTPPTVVVPSSNASGVVEVNENEDAV